MNPHVERFIGTLKSECLDHFIFFGEDHLRYVIREYLHYYNECRPHQGVGNILLNEAGPSEPTPLQIREVVCDEWVGGRLKSYRRAA